ncbi:2-oxo acid dehydrogenase subunit E2 [Eubacterium sp.]|uniref:2-oxo acid dehydrogenase subunit E2 n=1 Tax=Eubacterium sp. TaxID=142586 RepID=UPI002FC6BFF1
MERDDRQISREERSRLRSIGEGRPAERVMATGEPVRATPVARRYAVEKGVDLADVAATIPGRRIQPEDIDRYLEQRQIFAKQKAYRSRIVPDDAGFLPDEQEVFKAVEEEMEKEEMIAQAEALEEKLLQSTEPIPEPEKREEEETSEEDKTDDRVQAVAVAAPLAVPVIKASPLAEAMAAAEGIDLTLIEKGTGPDGCIIKADITAYLNGLNPPYPDAHLVIFEAPALPAVIPVEPESDMAGELEDILPQSEPEVEELSPGCVERRIQSPKVLTLTMEIDLTELKETRKRITKRVEIQTGCRCTYTDFILMAVAKALKQHPQLNGRFEGDAFVSKSQVHLGIGISHRDGLAFPVIANVQNQSFGEVVKVRNGFLGEIKEQGRVPEQKEASTFDLVNLGVYGLLTATLPLAEGLGAMLCVGDVVERYRYYQGVGSNRPVVRATLLLDSRIAGIGTAAGFLQDMKKELEHPAAISF